MRGILLKSEAPRVTGALRGESVTIMGSAAPGAAGAVADRAVADRAVAGWAGCRG